MQANPSVVQNGDQQISRRRALGAEAAGLACVVGLTLVQLALSWRRWNHPLVDFGRELYTPWRLAEGALLYRDVDGVYGPLSQYFNAILFRLFGPGLMVLAWANLVVVSALLGLVYVLFRRAWGPLGALAASGVFVSVFGFSQYLSVSNFNYVTPYAHEATHGMLVLLVLIAAAGRWVQRPGRGVSAGLGLAYGLTWVLKPEFILAGTLVIGATLVLSWRSWNRRCAIGGAVALASAAAPTLAFAVYFARFVRWPEAFSFASNAWLAVLNRPIATKDYQRFAMGLDHPWPNLVSHAWAALAAVAVCAGIWLAARGVGGLRQAAARWSVTAVVSAGVMAGAGRIDWIQIGRCLPGLAVLYLGWAVVRWHRSPSEPRGPWRVLLATAAVALLARMALNGRIYQFGFYQAALAAMVIVAVLLIEEGPPEVPARRWVRVALVAALLLPGGWALTRHSHDWLRRHTHPVGTGRDQFFALPPTMEWTGEIVNHVVASLAPFPAGATVLTLPEGGMINYLARRPSPLPQFQFYSFTTEGGLEAGLVRRLEQNPPDAVAIVGRDLTDFGVARYGSEGNGRELLAWVQRNYVPILQVGGDPLNSAERGAYVFKRAPADGRPR